MANIAAMAGAGLALGPQDRGMSWLPFYHDMGLVGCLLLPLATQMSIDYLATRDFIRRPGLWPTMMSRARATLSYAPSFGYRSPPPGRGCRGRSIFRHGASPASAATWCAPTISPPSPGSSAPTGSARKASCRATGWPSWPSASLSRRRAGAVAERLDPAALEAGEARPDPTARGARAFVACGPPLPEHAVAIRDAAGRDLGPRRVGRIHARGPSVMQGYFRDEAASAEVLSPDGWLDTGDTGYLTQTGALVITGRAKDLIIVNGRNIWPQDIEWTLESRVEGVRQGGVAAFAVERQDGEGLGLVLETRAEDGGARAALRRAADALVREVFGLSADLAFARPGGLPRTSSGKLSRAQAREMFVAGRFER